MLKIKCLSENNLAISREIIVGCFESTPLKKLFQNLNEYFPRQLQVDMTEKIIGRFKNLTTIHTMKTGALRKVHILGLGEQRELTTNRLHQAITYVLGEIHKISNSPTIGFYIEPKPNFNHQTMLRVISESFYLGKYVYNGYKIRKRDGRFADQLVVYVKKENFAEALIGQRVGEIFSQGTNLARTLMNQPGNKLTPETFKNKIVQIARRYSMSYEVLDLQHLRNLNMGGILSVAQGSKELPYVVTVRYKGNKDSDEWVGLIGKGVTFDTGGLQLKKSSGLQHLKKDMGGAATMVGVLDIIGKLQPKINVVLVIGCVDNMFSGSAYRPGDVISMMQGSTVEIISTDAEGRLILADCITYAKKLGATSLIDCATLTGSCRIALGYYAAGIMGNDDRMLEDFLKSAEVAGERAWPLPMFPEYRNELESRVADLKNCAEDVVADASIAGKFLEIFAGNTPWLHLDISSSGFIYEDTDSLTYGATGSMVRTIALFIQEAVS